MSNYNEISIRRFIKKEAEEYSCVCGYTGMHPEKKIDFGEFSATMLLACDKCEESREVEMNYPESIIYDY